jgi:DNA-binding NarL/FixJ family response regulator
MAALRCADGSSSPIEGLAARARLQLTPGDSAPEPGGEEVPTDDPIGLTSREGQVLELVARGATNREIGATLFMAEKTASGASRTPWRSVAHWSKRRAPSAQRRP